MQVSNLLSALSDRKRSRTEDRYRRSGIETLPYALFVTPAMVVRKLRKLYRHGAREENLLLTACAGTQCAIDEARHERILLYLPTWTVIHF